MSSATRSQTPRLIDLTERQRQIALLVALGLASCEIAGQLGIVEQTVKGHLSDIRDRWQLRDQPHGSVRELVSRAVWQHYLAVAAGLSLSEAADWWDDARSLIAADIDN